MDSKAQPIESPSNTDSPPALPPHPEPTTTTSETQTTTSTTPETETPTHLKWAVFRTPSLRYQLLATLAALGGTFMLGDSMPFAPWNETALVAIQQICNISLMFVTISLERVRQANAERRKAAEKAVDENAVVVEGESVSFMDEKAALAARLDAMDGALPDATKPEEQKKASFVPWTAEDAPIASAFRFVAFMFCYAGVMCVVSGGSLALAALALALVSSWIVILMARMGRYSTRVGQGGAQV